MVRKCSLGLNICFCVVLGLLLSAGYERRMDICVCVCLCVCVCSCLRLCVCFEGCLLRASGAGRCSSSHGSSDGRRERWGEESEGPNRFRDVTAMAESGQASQQPAGHTEGGLGVKICESENSDVEMGSS